MDEVNHPTHYTSHPSGVECIDITRHMSFNVGNAIKYLWRAGLKDEATKTQRQKHIQDLQKAQWYIQDEIKRLQGENENDRQKELELDKEGFLGKEATRTRDQCERCGAGYGNCPHTA